MLETKLQKLIEEQKQYCPILTSSEYRFSDIHQEILKQLDPQNVLTTESILLNRYNYIYHERPYTLQMHTLPIITLGFIGSFMFATDLTSLGGGVAATASAGALFCWYPQFKARLESKKKIRKMKKDELREGESFRPSYGTSLGYSTQED